MDQRSLLLAAAGMAACLTCFGVTADQIYKWVDKDGKVHYSGTPPATTGVQPEKVNVGAPEAASMPALPSSPPQTTAYRNGAVDPKATDEVNKFLKDSWQRCQLWKQQLDDLRNGRISEDPDTHAELSAADREDRERYLGDLLRKQCAAGGG